MNDRNDTDSTIEAEAEEGQVSAENLRRAKLTQRADSSSQSSFSDSSVPESVVYAICDGVDDGRTGNEFGSVSRGVVMSILRDQDVSRDSLARSSHTREESVFYAARLTARQMSLFPNKCRWWHKGQVRYGCRISNMTEEIVSKTFMPVYGPVEDKACAICLDDLLSDLVSLNGCLHIYHKSCFVDYALKVKKNKIVCPLCNCMSFTGKGPSPPGKMSWNVKKDMTLLSNGTFITTIEIKYKMKSGTQLRWHPSPGKPYKGVFKRAFLPITSDYLIILKMLILAFLDGQTFKVENSIGENFGNTVWNGIEHKTSIDGGAARGGFPDNNYKTRVLDNILSKGIAFSNY